MSLQIYFAGSIKGGRDDAALYARIIEELKSYGEVLTEHVGSPDVTTTESLDSEYVHNRDLGWLTMCDVLVAEVTQPSLGVGYEIGRAVAMDKPIVCFFRPSSGKRLSCMIEGAHNGTSFIVQNYEQQEFIDILKDYFAKFTKKG